MDSAVQNVQEFKPKDLCSKILEVGRYNMMQRFQRLQTTVMPNGRHPRKVFPKLSDAAVLSVLVYAMGLVKRSRSFYADFS